jgi:hypothetical protein
VSRIVDRVGWYNDMLSAIVLVRYCWIVNAFLGVLFLCRIARFILKLANFIYIIDIMNKVSVAHFSNSDEKDIFINDLIGQVRGGLRSVQDQLLSAANPVAQANVVRWGKNTGNFPLMCGFAQEMLVYNLQDHGVEAHPFTTDGIGSTPFSHCAAVMPYRVGQDPTVKAELLDPTFGQFLLPSDLYPEFGLKSIHAKMSPTLKLQQSLDGSEVLDQLTKNGYMPITPRHAQVYLDSLFTTRKFSPEQSMLALTHPADHPINLSHGRARLQQMDCLGLQLQDLTQMKGAVPTHAILIP